MKVSLVLLFACISQLLAVHVKGQNAVINLPSASLSVGQFLNEVEKQTNYLVIYSNREVDTQRNVDLEASSGTVAQYLDKAFAGTNVRHAFENDYIILTLSSALVERMKQGIPISGVVSDTEGNTLPGVNVVIKGTQQGTVTDLNGGYSLSVPNEDATLVFSFLGYASQEILVGNQRSINVTLSEGAREIEEVVVVGYGVQKKVNLTGAVGYVSSETFKDRPASNVSQMLQGAVPGLNVTRQAGRPGTPGDLNIRGMTSINGGEPLVLIDGVPGNINQINTNDVESISVLKDAASAAIYGARGAFGVILVTTKNAKSGKVSINYSNNFGWMSPTTSTDFMTNGYETVKLNDEAFYRSSGNTFTRYSDEDMQELEARRYDKTEHPDRPWVVVKPYNGQDIYHYYGNWDWYHYFYRDTKPTMRHDISFQGGTNKVDYLLSGSYYREEGMMKINTDIFNSYNFRAKINAKLNNWLTISNNTNYFNSSYRYYGVQEGDQSTANFVAFRRNCVPAYAPINPDGTATFDTRKSSYLIAQGMNANLLHGKAGGERNKNEFQTTTQLTANIGNALTVSGNFTYRMNTPFNWYRAAKASYSIRPGIIEEVSNYKDDYIIEEMIRAPFIGGNFFFNYDNLFGNHHFGATGGFNYENQQYKRMEGRKWDLLSLDLNDLNLATGTMEAYGNAYGYVVLGLFFRANYDYAGKYLLEINGRYDGTSRFGKGNRFGFFPSVSGGWRMSEEQFFEPLKPTVSMLKLRASYGTLGNQLPASNSTANIYPYTTVLNTGTNNWLFNSTTQRPSATGSITPVAGDLTWEKVSTVNFGIDLGFIHNRLTASFDWYERKTTGMLTAGELLPAVYGTSSPRRNAADLSTKGFEMSIKWEDRIQAAGKTLSYFIGASLSDSHAKITRFDNNPDKIVAVGVHSGSYMSGSNLFASPYVGMEVGEIWGYTVDGYFKTNEEAEAYKVNQDLVNQQRLMSTGDWRKLQAGDLKYIDLNGNDVIDRGSCTVDDPADLRKIGNRTARYAFGVNLGANWDGIDFSVFMQGIIKQEWYPGTECDKFWGPYARPYWTFLPKNFTYDQDVWSLENPNAYFPILRTYEATAVNAAMYNPNNRYLQNLGYFRLKNLTIGYTFPQQWMEKLYVQKCRLYFSGENLLTFTKLRSKYIDPEAPMGDLHATVYPFFKTISFGLDLTF